MNTVLEWRAVLQESHSEAETPDWLDSRAEVRLVSQLCWKQNKTSCDWWVLKHSGLCLLFHNIMPAVRLVYDTVTALDAVKRCVSLVVNRRETCGCSGCPCAELTCVRCCYVTQPAQSMQTAQPASAIVQLHWCRAAAFLARNEDAAGDDVQTLRQAVILTPLQSNKGSLKVSQPLQCCAARPAEKNEPGIIWLP